MRRRCLVACTLAMLALPATLHGQGVALSVRAGTLGPSVGATIGLMDKVNLRIDVPKFSYETTGTHPQETFDLAYTATLDLFSVSGLVDVHPFGNAFRLVGGMVLNRNEGTLQIKSASSHTVGNQTFTAEQIGTLEGLIEPGSEISPYVGIGFGNPVAAGKRVGLTLDLGVVMMGSPKFSMTGNGMIAPTTAEASKIQSNMEWAKYYPSVAIGLTFKVF